MNQNVFEALIVGGNFLAQNYRLSYQQSHDIVSEITQAILNYETDEKQSIFERTTYVPELIDIAARIAALISTKDLQEHYEDGIEDAIGQLYDCCY